MDYNLFNDHELVDGILGNDKPLIKYFSVKKYSVRALYQNSYFQHIYFTENIQKEY